MKKLSIGVRLTVWYLAIFLAVQIAFGAGMWMMLRSHLYDLADDSLESELEDLRNFLSAQDKNVSNDKLQELVKNTYTLEHSGDYLELRAADGSVIYRSSFLEAHPVDFANAPNRHHGPFRNLRIEGDPFRFTLQPVEANGRTYRALIGIQTDDVVDTLRLVRTYLLMLAPFLFMIAAAGGYWLSRRALAPVDELVKTAREISGSNLHSRVPRLQTGDELQRLSDTLNEMLARIESAFQRITEFTADASHELRTPISLMRTEAELALRRSRNETEYRESLTHILQEAERTTGLIEQLLAIARADSGREILHFEAVNLRETLGGVAASWRQVASIRNIDFSAQIGDELFVQGDETLLRRLTDILLDNAFKYTTSPGRIRLSLESAAGNAAIAVQDSGIGIAQEEQPKIFERFYRVDKARSRAHGGAGLGLSIAQWIVAKHGGSITVDSRPGEGSIFRVQLPLIPAPVRNTQPV